MESMKRTKGRQSLKLKFIEDKNSRIVAFTKRRNGIFRKASEFVVLTCSDIAIYISNLSGKTYSFAHTNIESLESQFLEQTLLSQSILELSHEVHVREIIQLLDGKDLRAKNVWEDLIGKLTPDEAKKVKKQLSEWRTIVFNILDQQNQRGRAT
ncbi:AGAMOUS-like 64 [Artemisia annua]|uniref:AGAMOUS-like 64 n=1 Tax=Artemisia annua TaxID=35608 RepID=A0A2U1MRY8_ARTAN|nr:AGAMOUS-like 64 [Artemisia annua]